MLYIYIHDIYERVYNRIHIYFSVINIYIYLSRADKSRAEQSMAPEASMAVGASAWPQGPEDAPGGQNNAWPKERTLLCI